MTLFVKFYIAQASAGAAVGFVLPILQAIGVF